MNLLFVAFSTRGYGETILGLVAANSMRERGHRVVFLAHEGAESLLLGARMESMLVPDHAMPLLRLHLDRTISQVRPDAIILADYFTTTLAFERSGMTVEDLARHGIPVVAIDTWDSRRSGLNMDVYGDTVQGLPDWSDALAALLVPAPLGRPGADGGAYQSIPQVERVGRRVRKHVRHDMGLADGDRAILICTAGWQTADYSDERAALVKRSVPDLVRQYIRALGPGVTVIHVGPTRFAVGPDDHYYWLPQLPPARFQAVVGSVDVFLSLNISATTIAAAMAHEVPVVNLHNSQTASNAQVLGNIVGGESTERRDWAEAAQVMYPFYVWPLGFYNFVRPVLESNPFFDAIATVELLDERLAVEALRSRLFDDKTRTAVLERQNAYVETVRAMPDAGTAIEAVL